VNVAEVGVGVGLVVTNGTLVGARVGRPSTLKVMDESGPRCAEKSYIRTPVFLPLRRDVKLGVPKSESSGFAPPLLKRSPASPRLTFFSRSKSPSA
jgi:hypothetical protein